MKHTLMRWGPAVLAVAALVGCGGGSDPVAVVPPSTTTVAAAISAASALPANDTSGTDPAANPSTPFLVVQDAGLPAVTVNSPPKVNFTVFSDGKVKTGLTINDVRFAIAKLVPGTDGNPDQWVNYVSTSKTGVAGKGPGGNPAITTAVLQATTDSKLSLEANEALGDAGQFVYNPDGYYTYTFKTDITDPTKTNGVVYEPTRTHRVAIQLSYKNAAGETVLVNPYFDFTIVDGKSVPATGASTRVMANVASCNGCHEKLALHGGGRVDTQYCVMCHNPGTTDPESGNVLTMSTMVHKIHAGRLLASTVGGEDYTIWGYGNSEHDYAEVGFPQDLRNCTVCHSADATKTANPTPQGDNWKTKPSKEACLTCHANKTGSDWDTSHKTFATSLVGAGAAAKDMTNKQCADCHKVGSQISPEQVHWNQNEENSAKYKVNIESVTVAALPTLTTPGKVTVKYFLSDPTNGDAAYDLAADTAKFGSLSFYLAYQNMVGQSDAVTEYSAYNNGGNGARATMVSGTNLGGNHYTVDITVPANTAERVAKGTARVVSIGQIKEPKINVKTRLVDSSAPRVNTLAQNTYKEFALTGTLQPRRAIVSNEKCNVCHGSLGATSGSNTLAEAFHSGARNTVEACVVCHDPNRMSSTIMTNGLELNESYQFKRMIHGIHGNSKRTYPFTHGNPVKGVFGKDGTLPAGGSFLYDYSIRNFSGPKVPAGTAVPAGSTFETISTQIKTITGYTGDVSIENYAAEVAWPGVGINCNVCHINNSYKQDLGPLGSVVFKDTGVTDPNGWKVISPKAASCTACHDSSAAMGHVVAFGGSAFGDKTQAQIAGLPRETCDDCHSSGGFKGVDIVHNQK
jgi:OmcA/MtrC family decaheme c-type cytochrome